MDKKTKIKVAVVIAVIIIAVIFILMVMFVKANGDKKLKESIPTKASNSSRNENNVDNEVGNGPDINSGDDESEIDVKDICSFAILDNSLVKIDNQMNYKEIKKISDTDEKKFLDYTYENNNIYLVYEEKQNDEIHTVVYQYDLNKNEEVSILDETEYLYGDGLKVYSDKLYYVTPDKKLIEYSIPEMFITTLVGENDESNLGADDSIAIDKNNNAIYMSANMQENGNFEAGVYRLDFTTNGTDKIITLDEVSGELILKNNSLIIDVKSDSNYYVYNILENTVNQIGTDTGKIAFYDDIIIYANEEKIQLLDASGNISNDEWYTSETKINDIYMIQNSKLEVITENGSNIIDLTTGEITETETFSNVINIK